MLCAEGPSNPGVQQAEGLSGAATRHPISTVIHMDACFGSSSWAVTLVSVSYASRKAGKHPKKMHFTELELSLFKAGSIQKIGGER